MKAFPNKEYVRTSDNEVMAEVHYGGMDLRDYFAAKAMAQVSWRNAEASANSCYEMADAMMKARAAE